ncbi:MAG: pyridoxal-dependent decarboxylase, partial [Bacteroidota bacterium]
MIEEIKRLEELASPLEPGTARRREVRNKVISYTEEFLSNIRTIKAFDQSEDKGIGIFDSPVIDEPVDIDEALKLLRKNVDVPGLNPASGGHLAYIPGGGIYYSSLGDYMADIFNKYAGIDYAGPGAVKLENMLIEWMAGIVGYPKGAGGNLASGGSIANLIAVVTARDAHDLKAKDFDKTVVYLSEHVHHSIDKALRIAGLKESIKRHVPLDGHYRMVAGELENAIITDRHNGLIPWLVIASAGTTDVGAIDPISEIGDITKKHKLWYHIDGAYGAFFALLKEGREKLRGMEKSDSITMDPHKGLFLPYGLGAVLVKDKQKLHNAHYYHANYMQDAVSDVLSPAELSPELTKHFRGLRMWLPLKLLGLKPFKACLEEKLMLAKYFYQKVQEIGFHAELEPELSVVTYKYVPVPKDTNLSAETQKAKTNQFNKKLLKEVNKDGRVFISSTMLNGEFTLRLA